MEKSKSSRKKINIQHFKIMFPTTGVDYVLLHVHFGIYYGRSLVPPKNFATVMELRDDVEVFKDALTQSVMEYKDDISPKIIEITIKASSNSNTFIETIRKGSILQPAFDFINQELGRGSEYNENIDMFLDFEIMGEYLKFYITPQNNEAIASENKVQALDLMFHKNLRMSTLKHNVASSFNIDLNKYNIELFVLHCKAFSIINTAKTCIEYVIEEDQYLIELNTVESTRQLRNSYSENRYDIAFSTYSKI